MLKILIPTIMLFPTIWLSSPKWLWTNMTVHSMIIASISFILIKWSFETGWTATNLYMATDPLSTPLLVLTCWLLPLMILASQHHTKTEPIGRQRTFITLLASLQASLILAFSATEITMFYVMFETTLIPTLILITRWGNQAERLSAGTYFLFYTLAGSLPLLVALMMLHQTAGTLSMPIIQYIQPPMDPNSWGDKLWWAACLIAFLVKMPLYGIHLWLPKAHVEAPVAGSMVLAAVLLKLGGYGMMRVMAILSPMSKDLVYPFIMLALWGVFMTGAICLRQSDMKSLIAYSSVSHMGLVTCGILLQTPWGFTGALVLMVSHGLVSSALFCLSNTTYERTHSRTMILARGLQIIFPLTALWWFIFNLANLALPPLPNLMGELMIVTALFNWSSRTLTMTGAGILITAAYSLYLYMMTQRGPLPQHITNLPPSHTREHLLMFLHLAPVILLMAKPEVMWGWWF
uniref:NADH-ubiquinone oxidoreductase chain 4 n=1 Tax=Pseudexostoma brachysoma TaxID=1194550 RepID=A0A0R7FJA3_9TELE|nr:NADH dehydrogenase subunit 4 [Pseudexostoma brachysoma]